MEPKRLYRSQTNKVISGVCGGLAEYFDVDPVIMRVLFVLLAFFGGSGFLLYLAALIIMPRKPPVEGGTAPATQATNMRKVFGIVLIMVGGIIMLANIGVFSFFHIWDISWSYVFPILLILLGMAIIYYKQSEPAQNGGAPGQPGEQPPVQPRVFRRSSTDKKIFGVCGGLAKYFSVDSTVLRLLYIVLCLASFGAGIVLYLTLALLVPDDKALQS